MKISYRYLSEHVDLSGVTPEILADKLTFAGAEVEGITRFAEGSNLVIGHVLSCLPHPNSDHLHILQVDEGSFGVHQIVCGAPNAREGLKVIVARTGAKLPGGEIKPSVIRGEESDGMCCSLLELGVDRKYLSEKQVSGIEELPADAPVGETNVFGYLGLDDVALDLSLLPNRPDLYAFENVSREVGCLLEKGTKIETPKEYPTVKTKLKVGSNSKSCPLFSARLVHDVKTHESPKWMKSLLETCGIRSINNIVDIGNLIMLLTGQPLNMYDADKLPKNELIVRDDFEGEFLAMDGNSYLLQKGDLVVCSGEEPMCLAGIMTAEACRVDESTKNIIIESAYFAGASIRHTSNRIGLASDSSLRFCKGINPDQAEYVQKKTCEALKEYAEAEEIEETALYDVYPHKKNVIETSIHYLNTRLGTSFSKEEIVAVLTRDHMKVSVDGEKLLVEVPAYRIDMDGEADISEEVIRILGYDNVHSVLPITELQLTGLTEKQSKERSIRRYLLSRGVSQVLTYTLLDQATAKKFAYLPTGEPYRVKNPMTVEREIVRPHLLPSVLSCASYNIARQNKDLAIFEISDIDAHGYAGKMLSLVLTGSKKGQSGIGAAPYDFFDAKGLLEGIMAILGLGPNRYSVVPWTLGGQEMHPGRSAEIRMGKKLLGYLGELHPLEAKEYDLKGAVVLDLDLSALLELKASAPKAPLPSRFPSVSRDLALIVGASTAYEDIRKELLKSSTLLKSVEVFDVYEGVGILPGKKSIALTLTFVDEEKTLKEEEIADAVKKAILCMQSKFGAEVRGQ